MPEVIAAVLAAVEVLLVVIVVLTALFGPEKFSDRAFRLLRRDARGPGRCETGRNELRNVG